MSDQEEESLAPNPLGTMCLATDLTRGFQCEIRRVLKKNCKKPSKAVVAHGDRDLPNHGLQLDVTYWHCLPALIYKAHQGTNEPIDYEEMVAEQRECNFFQARK